jgi:hypothetical protein
VEEFAATVFEIKRVFCSEDAASTFFCSIHLQNDKASHHRRQQSSQQFHFKRG